MYMLSPSRHHTLCVPVSSTVTGTICLLTLLSILDLILLNADTYYSINIVTSDDISKLRDPLSRAPTLTSFADLAGHMDSFLLASQHLTRSGQGETNYRHFELFLETVVSGFTSVPAIMAGYYTQYPAILQQSVVTLSSFL
jgi:hypothetical protein